MSSQYTNSYLLGSTIAVVGLSAAIEVNPGRGVNGGWFKILSGAGSLCITSGISQTWGATFYPVGASEVLSFNGPARFYLACAGATTVVSIGMSFTSGLNSPIAGG